MKDVGYQARNFLCCTLFNHKYKSWIWGNETLKLLQNVYQKGVAIRGVFSPNYCKRLKLDTLDFKRNKSIILGN